MRNKHQIYGFVLPILAFVFLVFTAGVGTSRYGLFPASIVNDAITAIEAQSMKYLTSSAPEDWTSDDAINKGTLVVSSPDSFPGYTLVTVHYSNIAYLLDHAGKVVHRWKMPFYDVWNKPEHIAAPVEEKQIYFTKAKLLPNGDLIAMYSALGDTPYGYGMIKLDKDSNIIWSYPAEAHHDFYIAPDSGNIYALTHTTIDAPIKDLENLQYPLLTDHVDILSPDGKKLRRISIMDALKNSPYEALLYQRPYIMTLSWDVLHTNSVTVLTPDIAAAFPMFRPGQILLSVRNLQALVVIDPDSEKAVWAATGPWRYQHAAHFSPNGTIMLLDNLGRYVHGETYSQILEFNPATNGVTWSYAGSKEHPFFTSLGGRLQRLGNNNYLITEMNSSRIFEVTRNGTIVWDYRLPEEYFDVTADELWQYKNTSKQLEQHPLKWIRREKLLTAISSAERYSVEELPFLQ